MSTLVRAVDTGLRKAVSVITLTLGFAAALGVALQLVTVVADVILRVAINEPIGNVVELSSYWYMVIMVFCGLAYAQRRGGHIDVDILYERLDPSAKAVLWAIGAVVSLLILCAITYWSIDSAMRAYEIRETAPASDLIIWPARFLVILGSGGMILEILRQVLVSGADRGSTPTQGNEASTV